MSITLSATDADAVGATANALACWIVGSPTKGVVGPPTGTMTQVGTTTSYTANVSYTPDPDKNGADNFTFNVNDGTVDSNTATVTIKIAAVNDTPVANDGSASATEDGPGVSIDLGALVATSRRGRQPHVHDRRQPDQGRPERFGSTRTYTPGPNKNGTDTFTYRVSDRGDPDNCSPASATCDTTVKSSAIKTITITIAAVNDTPIANDGSASATEDGPGVPIDLGALVNDVETPDGNLTYTIVDSPTKGGLAVRDRRGPTRRIRTRTAPTRSPTR